MVRRFERNSDSLVVVGLPSGYLFAAHTNFPGITLEQADENLLSRRLAGAARAKEAKYLAALHGKVQASQSGGVRIGVREPEVANVYQSFTTSRGATSAGESDDCRDETRERQQHGIRKGHHDQTLTLP